MECPIIPLGDKIIILPQEEGEQQYGNIIIPDAGKEKPEMGTVLAVGPGREVENETYVMASENDVLGIIKEKDKTYPEFVEKHYKKEENE